LVWVELEKFKTGSLTKGVYRRMLQQQKDIIETRVFDALSH
jgi:hypothetical protein